MIFKIYMRRNLQKDKHWWKDSSKIIFN